MGRRSVEGERESVSRLTVSLDPSGEIGSCA